MDMQGLSTELDKLVEEKIKGVIVNCNFGSYFHGAIDDLASI